MQTDRIDSQARFWKWAAAFFCLFVLLYFYELANFTLSIDEELAMYRSDARVWVAQGRWGIYLIERFVLPHPAEPVVPLALFGAFLAAAAVRLFDLFEVDSIDLRMVGFALIAGFPTLFMLAEFSTNVAPVGLAIFCTVHCARWTRHLNLRAATMFVAALALSISLYQSALFLAITLCAGLALHDLRAPSATLRSLARRLTAAAVLLLAGVVLYLLISKLMLLATHTQLSYVDRFFDPRMPIERPGLVAERIGDDIERLYLGQWDKGFERGWVQLAAVSLAVTMVLRAWWPTTVSALSASCANIALLAGSMLAPFTLHAFSHSQVPYRAVLAAPFALWLLLVSAHRLAHGRLAKNLLVLMFALFALQNWQSLNQFFHAAKTVGLHDQIIAARLSERIARVMPSDAAGGPIPLVVAGALKFENGYSFKHNTATAGSSFFEWHHQADPERIANYLHYLGMGDFRHADPIVEERLLPTALALPAWPAEGSVAWQDGTLLVRFPD